MQQALQRSRGLQPVGVAIPSTSLRLRSSHTCRRGSPPGPHQPQRVTPVQGMRRSPVITPDITLGSGDEEQSVGLFQYLLSQRIIFCGGYIDDKMCTKIVGSLMALDAASQTEEIRLYINSPGGSPYAVLGLVDTLQTIKAPVQTLALGACYSYASLVLAAGNKGKRLAMKNTRIMMTQPMGGSQGDWWQVSKTVEELNALYQLFARYYMKFTGMDQDTVEKSTSRDCFMTPEEALQAGLIDGIIRGKGDYSVPPSIVRQLKEVGVVDELTQDMFKFKMP